MKRIICLILCAALAAAALASCAVSVPKKDEGKVSVVTTIFPVYDWVRQIVGDRAESFELTMLLDNGADLHSYQPTTQDIVKVKMCDIFIYVGGVSDEKWVESVLSQAENEDMIVINLMDVLESAGAIREEEEKEGMESEQDHDSEEEGVEYDEHIWLSLRNAVKCCEYIGEKIGEKAGNASEACAANTKAYIEKLNALDKEYENAVDSATGVKTLVFAGRFPFRYMFEDYSLDYYAAFSGCSAEVEASFDTIVFLARKIDELGVSSIIQLENADGKLASTVRETTKAKNQTTLTMNSLQSTTSQDVENGASYLSIMEQNLGVLKDALK